MTLRDIDATRQEHQRRQHRRRRHTIQKTVYKAVWRDESDAPGVFRSCFSPEVKYTLNQKKAQACSEEDKRGFYVYDTLELALQPRLAPGSRKPTHILKCEVWGLGFRLSWIDDGKSRWPCILPVAVVAECNTEGGEQHS